MRDDHPPHGRAYLARKAVSDALRCGILNRPDICPICKQNVPLYAHHYLGYAPERVLDVFFLCKSDHGLFELYTPKALLKQPLLMSRTRINRFRSSRSKLFFDGAHIANIVQYLNTNPSVYVLRFLDSDEAITLRSTRECRAYALHEVLYRGFWDGFFRRHS